MGLLDLAAGIAPGRRRRRAAPRPDAPRTIVPVDDARTTAGEGLRSRPQGATGPAGPLDVARIDAARERLRNRIAPVIDDDLD